MGKFVAIGGGENGRSGTTYETGAFDKEILALTNKSTPNFLFIGWANTYSDSYYEVMKNIYGDMYGCHTDYLSIEDIKLSQNASNKINSADIIYVGGGNTLKLMTLLRKHGIDNLLRQAFENNTVLCGVSAGAIC